jgi:septation ring formation regulator EzrA
MKNFGENSYEKKIRTLEEGLAIIDAAIERSEEIHKTLDEKNIEWNEILIIFDGLLAKAKELNSSNIEPKTEEELDSCIAMMDRVNAIYARFGSLSLEMESISKDVDKLHDEMGLLEKEVERVVFAKE